MLKYVLNVMNVKNKKENSLSNHIYIYWYVLNCYSKPSFKMLLDIFKIFLKWFMPDNTFKVNI